MLLKPSYTTQESEKVHQKIRKEKISKTSLLYQYDDDNDGGVLVGNHIQPTKV